MASKYNRFRGFIESLNLNENETYEVTFNADPIDKRMQPIKTLLNTESLYLKKITKLLTIMFIHLDDEFKHILRTPIASKEEIITLLYYFPRIYTIHLTLYNILRREMESSKLIGKMLFQFFAQRELLYIYEDYVTRIGDSLAICSTIKTKTDHRHLILQDLVDIIMAPVQKFPQLALLIADIYKNTPIDHSDKIGLFKAMSITRSITSRLNRQRQNYEYNDIRDIAGTLSQLKLPFSSTKVLSNNSVLKIKTHFYSTEKIDKEPYYLMLCDRNVIMLPRNVPLRELTTDLVFSFSLSRIDCEQEILTRFHDSVYAQSSVYNDNFQNIRSLYLTIKGSTKDDSVIKNYGEILHDFTILSNVRGFMKQLNFVYGDTDKALNVSLLQLEKDLKEKELELNFHMSSIIILKDKKSCLSCDQNVLLFDSKKQANEWRIYFNRTKLLSEAQSDIDWLYYSAGTNLPQLNITELPLVFPPYSISIDSVVIKCESVYVVVDKTVCRCLWTCLSNGTIVLLHFNYQSWQVLERFQLDTKQPIRIMSSFTEFDCNSKRIIDSEIWMASGFEIFIHSLVTNQNSVLKTRFSLKSEIKSLCNVGNKVLIGLKSNKILAYAKEHGSFWFLEKEISLELLQQSKEEIRDILCDKTLVYITLTTQIISFELTEMTVLPISYFETENKITAVTITTDGLWMSFENRTEIVFYDKFLTNVLQSIELPSSFLAFPRLGSVTSIYANEKYIWIGTGKGYIICMSTIDSSYCTDSHIPMYFSSRFATGPITQLLPFYNIQTVKLQKDSEPDVDQHIQSDQSDPSLTYDSSQDMYVFNDDPKDETDSLSASSLRDVYKNWKRSSLELILAFGTGITKYVDKSRDSGSAVEKICGDQSIIFTFFE